MITADNYKEYLKTFLIASAHKVLEEGCEIPDTIGIIRYAERPDFGVRPMVAASAVCVSRRVMAVALLRLVRPECVRDSATTPTM